MTKDHITWDYEPPGYYHIWSVDDGTDDLIEDDILVYLPETPENDAVIHAFVKALNARVDAFNAAPVSSTP